MDNSNSHDSSDSNLDRPSISETQSKQVDSSEHPERAEDGSVRKGLKPMNDFTSMPSKNSRRSSSDDLYSPKKVAAAIGVSESSLKRWCDAGYVQATKTAGGHRRVSRAEVISFLKRKKYALRDPIAIGLPDIRNVSISDDVDAVNQLTEALKAGEENACRKLLVYMYINGRTIPDLFDRIISPAFREIGERWHRGEMEVYEERLACQICHTAAIEIRSLIPAAREGAPLAIGCTLEGDHYQLATLGVEMCLSSFGWRATSLGSNIPIESLYRAFENQIPQLIWISISHSDAASGIAEKINQFRQQIANRCHIVIGGNDCPQEIRNSVSGVTYCENFAQLILAAQKLYPRI